MYVFTFKKMAGWVKTFAQHCKSRNAGICVAPWPNRFFIDIFTEFHKLCIPTDYLSSHYLLNLFDCIFHHKCTDLEISCVCKLDNIRSSLFNQRDCAYCVQARSSAPCPGPPEAIGLSHGTQKVWSLSVLKHGTEVIHKSIRHMRGQCVTASRNKPN